MNRKTLLVTTLAAGLGLANANATLLVRQSGGNAGDCAISGVNQ